MMKAELNRRRFLRGLGATGLALPLLPSWNLAAQESGHPTRLLVFFSANGTVAERWRPTGGGRNFELGEILSPLLPYRDNLLILDGVDMVSARHGIGDGHQTGMGHMLTGTELMPGPFPGGGNAGDAGYAGGISVDQFIAREIAAPTRFSSLEFGVKCGGSNNWSRMCYAGADQPIAPEEDPANAFARIFGNLGDVIETERLHRQRRSVLDFVRSDFQRMENKISQRDRNRVQMHFDSVRSLERRLMTGNELGIACEAPNLGGAIDAQANENFAEVGRMMMDMIVMAFACDQTRVASLQWSRSVSQMTHPWAGVNDKHHDLSHEGDENQDAIEKLVKINRWYAEQFAYLVRRMSEIPEGDGTMLDHTAIVWVNELGRGNSHTRNNVPYVVAGSANGYFDTGRFLTFEDDPHNNFLVSLCRAMGVSVDTFGNPAYCTGPLQGLSA